MVGAYCMGAGVAAVNAVIFQIIPADYCHSSGTCRNGRADALANFSAALLGRHDPGADCSRPARSTADTVCDTSTVRLKRESCAWLSNPAAGCPCSCARRVPVICLGTVHLTAALIVVHSTDGAVPVLMVGEHSA
jgi:hypothetical protein